MSSNAWLLLTPGHVGHMGACLYFKLFRQTTFSLFPTLNSINTYHQQAVPSQQENKVFFFTCICQDMFGDSYKENFSQNAKAFTGFHRKCSQPLTRAGKRRWFDHRISPISMMFYPKVRSFYQGDIFHLQCDLSIL